MNCQIQILYNSLVAFIATLSGLMFSIFLVTSHGDLKDGAIEPMELSNTLQQFLPYDYLCSGIYILVCLATGHTQFLLAGIPLALFNLSRERESSYQIFLPKNILRQLNFYMIQKEHKMYFITRRDYLPRFDAMKWQFYIKSAYYGALFVISTYSLVIAIMHFLRVMTG